uniref:Uncharacterized protein n=1 Tax=Vespula pensylvanica TaxID=30213 RepID=A0A834UHA0_VESPE|nr:hypothetical protein H0235_001987 [Vespula pensylvanica]
MLVACCICLTSIKENFASDANNTASFMKQQDNNMTGIEDINSPDMDINARTSAPSYYGRNMTFPRPASSYADRHELPAVVIEGENNRLLVEQQENSSCSDGHLSGVMPDVAMATASFGALQLMEHQELDLGDGTSHILQHISPSTGTVGLNRSSLPRQHQGHISAPPPLPYAYQRTVTALPRFI